eukprot:11168353-Lingulodinium_polyedra.AAC.1
MPPHPLMKSHSRLCAQLRASPLVEALWDLGAETTTALFDNPSTVRRRRVALIMPGNGAGSGSGD